ncbi:putative E3 ubiquitin-protein ligase HERC2-like [Capsicum annuum]|nr:putative E3 ubiquitin-protein ligase HERC2-like [Capsicum annuum]
MAQGKVASQCAHAATGMYADLMQSDQYLLRQWEQCGQPKIVVTCKNQQEMNKLKEAAENIGLPTFVVADAGRTQLPEESCSFSLPLFFSFSRAPNASLAWKLISDPKILLLEADGYLLALSCAIDSPQNMRMFFGIFMMQVASGSRTVLAVGPALLPF